MIVKYLTSRYNKPFFKLCVDYLRFVVKFRIVNELIVEGSTAAYLTAEYNHARLAGKLQDQTLADFLTTETGRDLKSFIKGKTKAAQKSIISATENGFDLEVPIDAYPSTGFYIQGNTFFWNKIWLGTLTNNNQDIYLRGDALKILYNYQLPFVVKAADNTSGSFVIGAPALKKSSLKRFSQKTTSSKPKISEQQASELSPHLENSIFNFKLPPTVNQKVENTLSMVVNNNMF